MEKSKKKSIIFMGIGALTLIVVVLSATYAYFVAQGGGSANTDVDVITSTTDNLSFSFGDLISIDANEMNFAEGMPSLSDSTTGTAILRANNATNSATATYNIYLIIESNDFEYTTENQTPELLLKVTDPNGMEVENITGLVHYADGFDITTRTGGFLLVPDYEISATDVETIQDWNIEITFANLDSDQSANAGKALTGKLYLTQEQMSSYELTEINSIETTTTYNSIDAILNLTNGSASVTKYYYGIEEADETIAYQENTQLKRLSNSLASAETVEYIESDSANYVFSNLQPNTEYTIYSYIEDENKVKSNIYTTSAIADNYNGSVVNSISTSVTLNSITVTANATAGSNAITKYMYKINDEEWVESESNSYTFNGLTDSTEYDIRVKVVDSEDMESPEFYEKVTTEIYQLPVVSSVNATTTYNSITLTPTGTNGTNAISRYEYSINNGAYQTSNVFNNLNENTSYTIRVKAIDTAGRESNVYTTTVHTDTYRLPTISNVSLSSTADSITINVTASRGDGNIVSYHYSRNDGSSYAQSSSNSYTFNGLTSNTTFYIKVYVTDSNGRTSTVYSGNIATENDLTFAEYITTQVYTGVDGDNGLYYHDADLANGAQDNSYRYSGANPNNYVCFGAIGADCQNANNQYRIIGVFNNQVKLIKATSYGDYAWEADWDTQGNTWNISTKPDIYTTLNETYYNTIPADWQNLMAEMTWKVGGMDYNITNTAKQYYDVEVGTAQSGYEETMKIGLMYLSDYGYGASPEKWTTALYEENYGTDNWLYLGSDEWLISRSPDGTFSAFCVYSGDGGGVISGRVDCAFAVRPSFSLASTVEISSGTGTSSDPFVLNLG